MLVPRMKPEASSSVEPPFPGVETARDAVIHSERGTVQAILVLTHGGERVLFLSQAPFGKQWFIWPKVILGQ